MKLVIGDIILRPDQPETDLARVLFKQYSLEDNIKHVVLKRSLDARNKKNIYYRYRVMLEVPDERARELLERENISEYEEIHIPAVRKGPPAERVYVTGSGPAGLFCALRLIEAGFTVTVVEQGKPVPERMNDIGILEKSGTLHPWSNVLFGEGGAGTYSDGKLTTRTNRPEMHWFYEKLVQLGVSPSLLCNSRPHLGTDGVRTLVRHIRDHIHESGSEIRFNTRLEDLVIKEGVLRAIRLSPGEELPCPLLVLGTGHSARDTYRMLHEHAVHLEKKGFATGVRVEHPAELIQDIQYGKSRYRDILPSAEYSLACNNRKTGRGVYSFCMCPGGRVINSSSEENGLCTNGMSNSRRDSEYSNSAIVVTVRGDDTGDGALGGIEFQREIESCAYGAGGGRFTAPVQRIPSFFKRKLDTHVPQTSYRPDVSPSVFDDVLPAWITDEIRFAFKQFDKRMKGFITEEGIVIGVETRTSSPVRITRGPDMQSVSVAGLFPAGEGAGYSGGIVSSAVDGIRVADAIIMANSS